MNDLNLNVTEQILKAVEQKLEKAFGQKVKDEAVTINAAKALGLVVGKRGPYGGYFPTQKGSEFIGLTATVPTMQELANQRERIKKLQSQNAYLRRKLMLEAENTDKDKPKRGRPRKVQEAVVAA